LLSELETKQANVRATLTRISGAIQVLEEELAKADQRGNRSVKADAADGPLGDPDAFPASL
jgi:hypothetical protein